MAHNPDRGNGIGFSVVFAVVGLCLLSMGCGSGERQGVSKEGACECVSEWVDRLKLAYSSGGIRAFETARNLMREQDGGLKDDLDYDTASMVLGLRETVITRKESELAGRLRRLAEHIETHPGRAHAEQEQLMGKLFSYSFGNGPIDFDSVSVKLVELYSLIADGEKD